MLHHRGTIGLNSKWGASVKQEGIGETDRIEMQLLIN